jgi:hypothetical protein
MTEMPSVAIKARELIELRNIRKNLPEIFCRISFAETCKFSNMEGGAYVHIQGIRLRNGRHSGMVGGTPTQKRPGYCARSLVH